MIEGNVGKEENIYTIYDDKILDSLSCFNGGVLPFYTLEDIYIAEYKEYVVCFVMGNNE